MNHSPAFLLALFSALAFAGPFAAAQAPAPVAPPLVKEGTTVKISEHVYLIPAFATPQSSGRAWLASLDELDKLKPRTVIGAHFPVADASLIGDYRNYLKALQARVAELKKEGKSSEETAVQVRGEFAGKYPDWAQPIRVHPAATVFYKEAE